MADLQPGILVPESVYSLNTTLEEILFPALTSFNEDYLKVSDIHFLWYGEYGNSQGIPILVVHGGPGAGCGPNDMRYFDPKIYHIILLDQRGANRSKPAAEIKENTTKHLIEDMETLRKHLGINKWVLFGGSWGSALSLAYGEAYPESCLGFILRGIFLGNKAEYRQLWYGMKDVFPVEWEEMVSFLPLAEQNDLISAYNIRLIDQDPGIHMPAAQSFVKYDLSASFLKDGPQWAEKILKNDIIVLALARLFTHYCTQHFFFEDNQLINNVHKISHLPCIIVQGRYDIVCRLHSAYALHKAWTGSQLTIVSDSGHAAIEPGNAKALVEATKEMQSRTKIERNT